MVKQKINHCVVKQSITQCPYKHYRKRPSSHRNYYTDLYRIHRTFWLLLLQRALSDLYLGLLVGFSCPFISRLLRFAVFEQVVFITFSSYCPLHHLREHLSRSVQIVTVPSYTRMLVLNCGGCSQVNKCRANICSLFRSIYFRFTLYLDHSVQFL